MPAAEIGSQIHAKKMRIRRAPHIAACLDGAPAADSNGRRCSCRDHSAGLNLDALGQALGLLRDQDLQHAVLALGLDALGIGGIG